LIRCVLAFALIAAATWSTACSSERHRQELFDSASAALQRGELAGARTLAEQGIGENAGRSDVWTWKFKLLRAEALLASGQPGDVQPLITEAIPDTPGLAWAHTRRKYIEGRLAVVRGQLPEAARLLQDAVQLAERNAAPDVRMDAEVLLGQVLLRLGRDGDADVLLNGVVDRASRARDTQHQALALLNLGMGRIVRSRFDEALPYFERVIALTELSPQLVYNGALINAGLSYARLGEFDRAIDLLQRAVASQQQGGSRAYLQQALGEMGNAYLLSGRTPEGIPHLERALQIAKDSQRTQDSGIWASSLAAAHIELQQWDRAAALNEEARQFRTDARNRAYQIMNDAQIAEGRGDATAAARIYREAGAAGQNDAVIQWQAAAGLGRLDLAAGRWREALQNYEAAVAIVERTRLDLSRTEHKLSIQARLLRLYREYVDVLVQRGQTERALVVADFSRARVLAERHGMAAPARPSAVAFRHAAAELKSVLLFYWIGPGNSYAWAVTRDRIHFVPLRTTGLELTRAVTDFRQLTVDSIGDPIAARSAGDLLYDKVLAPVLPLIPADARVVIVPDGPLNPLNFESLPVPSPTRHYWIQDVEVAIAPSLGTLSAEARPVGVKQDRPVLLIGDPVSSDPKFPQLRYASMEMSAVSKAFAGRTTVYRGDQATPSRYREAKPDQFGIVHFTAHASANAESPLDSAVILSGDGSGYKLHARDVAEQKLSADLVTISACRSAGERTYVGEGLVGFAWAFLRAGAQRVIAGLWDVDDRSTADLMGRVYTEIARGRSPSAALRAAKLDMIARGGAAAKPYYWGPFQVFIGSRVVP
jgi:CHAT domain-containing protein